MPMKRFVLINRFPLTRPTPTTRLVFDRGNRFDSIICDYPDLLRLILQKLNPDPPVMLLAGLQIATSNGGYRVDCMETWGRDPLQAGNQTFGLTIVWIKAIRQICSYQHIACLGDND